MNFSAWVLAALVCVAAASARGQEPAAPAPAAAPAPPAEAPPAPAATLEAIHDGARKAREAKEFARVEELRLERLALLAAATEKDKWTAGAAAIAEADGLIKAMRYDEACQKLAAAWKPFETPARDEPVFGDIAMKLFEATQAALAVYPRFDSVKADDLRQAVRLAADNDPCQLEALAADAFLTDPDPREAFQPAELRPSLRLRNQRLLDISYAPDRDDRPLPWHAPVEFLKAKSSSFVLEDLNYYERFLDPRHRLRARDAHGEPVNVVMGGSLLISAFDGDGSKRPFVAEWAADDNRWVRLRPRILRVEPPAFKEQPWRIEEAKLSDELRRLVEDARDERLRLVRRRLMTSADGLKGANKVKPHIQKMLGWMTKPPEGKPAPGLQEVADMITKGYGNYAVKFPEELDEAKAAAEGVAAVAAEWKEFSDLSDGVLDATKATPVASGESARTAATALSKFLALMNADDDVILDVAEQDDDDEAEGDKAKGKSTKPADEPADDTAKPGKKKPKDVPETGSIRLRGRELRAKLTQQKEYYDLLGLFQLMNGVHRPAIEAMLGKAEAAPPAGATPGPADQRRAEAAARIKAALRRYDEIRGRSTGTGPTPNLTITLDVLRRTTAALREVEDALALLGDESDYSQFVAQFNRTCELIEKPLSCEGDLAAACTPSNRAGSWKVGRATWSLYDFPRDFTNDRLAEILDYCPRVAASKQSLEQAIATETDGDPETVALLDLRTGSTTEFGNRLVSASDGRVRLRFLKDSVEPYMVVLLDVDADTPADFRPEGIDEVSGPEIFRLDDPAGPLPMTVQTQTGAAPELIVEFAGAKGHVPLRAAANAFDSTRFLTDGRGNTIVRDRSGETSPTKAHFYRMTSKSGSQLTDRSVNYVIQDWLDLDRNIMNAFLPNLLVHGPSLPGWRLYRQEFKRAAPDDGWRWTVPRRAFTATPAAPPPQ